MRKILILFITLSTLFAITSCGSSGKSESIFDEAINSIIEQSLEKETKDEDSQTVFSPQDVSDESIESIQTYGDFLTMVKMIHDDFFANYERSFKGTKLYDEDDLRKKKAEMDESYNEQLEQYGEMNDVQLFDQDTFVQFLKNYRDSYNQIIEDIKDGIKMISSEVGVRVYE